MSIHLLIIRLRQQWKLEGGKKIEKNKISDSYITDKKKPGSIPRPVFRIAATASLIVIGV